MASRSRTDDLPQEIPGEIPAELPAEIKHLSRGDEGAFVIEREGRRLAELTWTRSRADDTVSLDHTWVHDSLRGQGVARRLLDAAVAWARKELCRVVPRCPYAQAQFAQDPSIHDVLAGR